MDTNRDPMVYSWKDMTLKEFLKEGTPSLWRDFFNKPEVLKELDIISEKLSIRSNKVIYPEIYRVFRALYMTGPEDVRVVILGMDPYTDGNAVGLCFSVPTGGRINPSLRNIYKELENEGYSKERNGSLVHWAKQGCLLLNTALTVEKGNTGSHIELWSKFTEMLLGYINEKKDVIWLLMGKNAIEYKNDVKRTIIMSSHPSPLSAYKGIKGDIPAFLGSGNFRKINEYLEKIGEKIINW